MSAAIVVPTNLPAAIIALSDEKMAKATELTITATSIAVTPDAASLEQANGIYRAIDKHAKDIAAARLELTRPIDALKAAVIEAERKATVPMTEARLSLGKRIAVADAELRRIHEDAARKAREEAEAKARAERERQEKERAEIIAKQAAERKAAEEEAALFGNPETVPAEEPPPPVVVVVPVIEAKVMPALPKSAVRTSTRQRLVIDDASAIPVEVGGVRTLVPDEAAITRLLKAGLKVNGCRLESYEAIGSAGSRGAA